MKEENSGRMYYTIVIKGTETRKYCHYMDRLSLTKALDEKREALKRAIEIYLEEVRLDEHFSNIASIEIISN